MSAAAQGTSSSSFGPAPVVVPPLDPHFQPLAIAFRAWREEAQRGASLPLVLVLERPDGSRSRFETPLACSGDRPLSQEAHLAERLLKSFLWLRGGSTLYLAGTAEVVEHLARAYSPGGQREFDRSFMGRQIHGREFRVIRCSDADLPEAVENGRRLDRDRHGFRVGFDLGASDLKVVAMADSEVILRDEVPWNPGHQPDPEYHYTHIRDALRRAAEHLPRLDAIGGSAAGIFVNNRCRVSSLFRAIEPRHRERLQELFPRLEREFGVPLVVINDGTAAALRGALQTGEGGVLGVAMGSSEAGGYVTVDYEIPPWLDEVAFVPLDLQPGAPVDDWSGDRGVGAQYLSQQAIFRLAEKAGLKAEITSSSVARLRYYLERAAVGDERAVRLWETVGTYAGYGLAWYAELYDLRHVFLLGRVCSGAAGDILLAQARTVLRREFPELASRVHLHLPDERVRRLGQAEISASLLSIEESAPEDGS